jgi:hypothetical protein
MTSFQIVELGLMIYIALAQTCQMAAMLALPRPRIVRIG